MFSFLMKYDSLTFPEAAKVLADRAGIDVPDIEISDEKRHEADLKNNIYEINAKAARYFHYLLGTKDGDAAKAYFAKRELEDKTVTSFGLGFSSMRKDALYQYLKKEGCSDDILKETGLFVYDERGVHDRFRNRVMFPILNINNKVIEIGRAHV